MNLLDTLKKARTLIRKGWTQGSYCDPSLLEDGDCYCLVGALSAAAETKTYKPPRGACKALGFRRAHDMIFWNDQNERTKTHVIQRLTDAIKKLAA